MIAMHVQIVEIFPVILFFHLLTLQNRLFTVHPTTSQNAISFQTPTNLTT
jgi:hypothetical protein